MAPTAPMTPSAAEDCLVATSSAEVLRSAVPPLVARTAPRRKIAGIIL